MHQFKLALLLRPNLCLEIYLPINRVILSETAKDAIYSENDMVLLCD